MKKCALFFMLALFFFLMPYSHAATQTIKLPSASHLVIKGNYTVDIQQNPAFQQTQITLTGDDEALKGVKIEKRKQDQKKNIQIAHPNTQLENTKITVHIRTNGLENIASQGKSRINISHISANEFTFKIQGTHEIRIGKIKNSKLRLQAQGSNQIVLSGATHALYVDLLGNSKLDAIHLSAQKTVLTSKGVATIQLNVKETLERNLQGHVNLLLKGHPSIRGYINGLLELKVIK